jgi:hypothetical protein
VESKSSTTNPQAKSRHPWATAFSMKRLADADCHVKRPPTNLPASNDMSETIERVEIDDYYESRGQARHKK